MAAVWQTHGSTWQRVERGFGRRSLLFSILMLAVAGCGGGQTIRIYEENDVVCSTSTNSTTNGRRPSRHNSANAIPGTHLSASTAEPSSGTFSSTETRTKRATASVRSTSWPISSWDSRSNGEISISATLSSSERQSFDGRVILKYSDRFRSPSGFERALAPSSAHHQ